MRVLTIAVLMFPMSASAGSSDGVVKRLTKHYVKSLQCDAVSVVELPGSSHPVSASYQGSIYNVEGCGQSFLASASKADTLVYLLDDQSLRRRAAAELGCETLEYTPVDRLTRVVAGCDKRITYVFNGKYAKDGTWIANLVQE